MFVDVVSNKNANKPDENFLEFNARVLRRRLEMYWCDREVYKAKSYDVICPADWVMAWQVWLFVKKNIKQLKRNNPEVYQRYRCGLFCSRKEKAQLIIKRLDDLHKEDKEYYEMLFLPSNNIFFRLATNWVRRKDNAAIDRLFSECGLDVWDDELDDDL